MDGLLRETHEAEQQHFWFRGLRGFARPLLAAATSGGARRPLDAGTGSGTRRLLDAGTGSGTRRLLDAGTGSGTRRLLDATRRLLDAGCGTGANLTLLSDFGDAYGFDLTLSGLTLGAARGTRRLTCATVRSVPFADATFDVVTSFDVLYCLDDVDEGAAVSEMFRLLRPGGAAIINVPAFAALRGEHSVFDGEVRRYTRPRLRERLEPAGFTVERITCTNATLFLPLLVLRTWQRLRGLRPPATARSDLAQPPWLVNAVLSAVLTAEARVVRWVDLPLGSSILCLARKPRPAGLAEAA